MKFEVGMTGVVRGLLDPDAVVLQAIVVDSRFPYRVKWEKDGGIGFYNLDEMMALFIWDEPLPNPVWQDDLILEA